MEIKLLNKRWLKILLIIIAFISFDFVLNFTIYNPEFITPIYALVLNYHFLPMETAGYPLTSIKTLNSGLYSSPRASIIGTVIDVVQSEDSDWHVNVRGEGGTMVTEIIPEYPLLIPVIGDRVRIWGITRYDIAHRWWELHPVIGWKKL